MRKFLPLAACLLLITGLANAQCTTASLNWDALKFLAPGTYVTAAMASNQNFALGKNKVNIKYSTVSPNVITSVGDVNSHTGDANAYGKGADIAFKGGGTITLEFQSEVSGVKFSIFGIDDDESLTISATSSIGAPSITITPQAAINDLTITGSPGTTPNIRDSKYSVGGQSSEGLSANTSSINVDIAASVKTITLTMSGLNTTRDIWLSDISACVTGSFPTNYYNISRPWGTMPGYVLAAINSSIYMVDPATGKAKFIFSDGATSGTLNSMCYDPYNRVIYYTFSLTNNGSANASEKRLRKYDFATNTSTTIVNDITSLGIPTFTQGVESGAAAFYDGAWYLGIEGGADNGNGGPKNTSTGLKSIIWRLDFTAGVPTSATQVYAVSGDTHDWSDFSINDGMLYDFNGDATTPDYHHLTMQTGANLLVPFSAIAPKQSCVGWDGKIYWLSNQIGQYNLAGGVGTRVNITSTPAIPNWSNSTAPSYGDGGEAYRPMADFGDAPASYDPDATAPAVHEVDANLRLGAAYDIEWEKPTVLGTNADADGADENGLLYTTLLNQNGSTYHTQVNVYNNTGANATLAGWVDFNNNGLFDAAEGITQTINTSTLNQMVDLYWSGISNSLPAGTNVYLRLRITSATNLMTTSSATGYFANGEVEDYKVVVNFTPLEVSIQSFEAIKTYEKVSLAWKVSDEEKGTRYELERSGDSKKWNSIYTHSVSQKAASNSYQYTDANTVKPFSYYRIKITNPAGNVKYTDIKKVQFTQTTLVSMAPNPAKDKVYLQIDVKAKDVVQIKVFDMQGRNIHAQMENVESGINSIPLQFPGKLNNGLYSVQLIFPNEQYMQKLIIQK